MNHDETQLVINETTGDYVAQGPVTANEIISTARSILARQVRRANTLTSPKIVSDYLITRFAGLEHEVFGCLFLDNRYRLIHFKELFRGTINGCSVYPREVMKAALRANASAIILAHNHPSGIPEPSQADTAITQRLKEALTLIDIATIDHVVVGGGDTVSFAERGLL